jgi:hypothetical protein
MTDPLLPKRGGRGMPDLKLPALFLGLCLALGPSPRPAAQSLGPSAALRPGREISLPPSQVKDTFFAYFLGIVLTGTEVDIDNAQMRDILTEFKTQLKFPFDLVSRVIQHSEQDTGERTISLIFNGKVSIPIPYSFLGYHPGMLRSTERLTFNVTRSSYIDPQDPSVYTPVYDLALDDGAVLIDIDDWLVYLLSRVVDKLEVRHIVFFSYHGEWIGLVEGRGRVFSRRMREYFSFTNNRIIYPVPDKLDAMGLGFINASLSSVAHR